MNNVDILDTVEDFIGKKFKDFDIDDIQKMKSDETYSKLLTDRSFLNILLTLNNDEDIKACFYHTLIMDKLFKGVNDVVNIKKIYANTFDINVKTIDRSFIKSNENLKETTDLLINLNNIASIPLVSNNPYTKIMAYIEICTLFNSNIMDKKNEIKEALNMVYKDLNNINAVFGYGTMMTILKHIIEPLDTMWTHKYNESIVDENNTDYSEAMKKLLVVTHEITKNDSTVS